VTRGTWPPRRKGLASHDWMSMEGNDKSWFRVSKPLGPSRHHCLRISVFALNRLSCQAPFTFKMPLPSTAFVFERMYVQAPLLSSGLSALQIFVSLRHLRSHAPWPLRVSF